jgi:hypothetical protein
MSINGGHTLYGAMEQYDNFAGGMIGLGSNIQAFSGGGKKKASKKKGTKKKAQKRTPMRKALSSKAKSMSKMRVKNIRKLTQRQKQIEKRLNQRKKGESVVNSLVKSNEIPKELERSLSPSMRNFVSKIPRVSSNSSSLSPWPSSGLNEVLPVAQKGRPSTKSFEDARKGLGDILKKKQVYPVESRSVIKFSDYKSKLTPKEKAALKAKSKKKGRTR